MAEADPIAEKENFESGPLSLLTKVVKDNSQVRGDAFIQPQS